MITNNQEKNNNIQLEQILQEMNLFYSWSNTTYQTYLIALKQYTKINNLNIHELITEAEQDETTIIKINKRHIKTRLTQYVLHLKQEGYKNNTIKNYLTKIIKVYKYLDIETPKIETPKNNNQEYKETFKDLPTNEEITTAIYNSRTKMKAIITFIASTGLRRSDVANLTIKDFMIATKEYHQCFDIISFIEQMKTQKEVIPVWEITTKKTNTNHLAFSSPESTKYILQMLSERVMKQDINIDNRLFEVSANAISINFKNLNNRLGFGYKGDRIRFHPHALRKFFATTLNNNDVDYLSTEFLLGHSLKGSDSSYYFANPDKLKLKYSRVVDKLTFTMKVSYLDIDSKEKMELEALKRKYKEANKRILNLEESLNLITRDIKI